MRTYSPKPADIQRVWHVIDAEDVVLGRLAVEAATLLRGKHKPIYAPHMDTGDFVIVVNAEKVAPLRRQAHHQAGLPPLRLPRRSVGHPDRSRSSRRTPRKVIEKAVWGMLPKNKLSRAQLSKLKVYAGPTHPHAGPAGRPVRDQADLPVVD